MVSACIQGKSCMRICTFRSLRCSFSSCSSNSHRIMPTTSHKLEHANVNVVPHPPKSQRRTKTPSRNPGGARSRGIFRVSHFVVPYQAGNIAGHSFSPSFQPHTEPGPLVVPGLRHAESNVGVGSLADVDPHRYTTTQ
jgi:hypothetical protein